MAHTLSKKEKKTLPHPLMVVFSFDLNIYKSNIRTDNIEIPLFRGKPVPGKKMLYFTMELFFTARV